ncbi:hypothetical protein M9H77_16168 [Catharanthus roseus]|uniref:Uncharacterized protein n=1 Tax=Catharanthus roseus TaxID=4058 RepID=A0ACC0B0L1_CATRO|nr:hypothetical protein M9H77_16168 [Catharanthus roseus]
MITKPSYPTFNQFVLALQGYELTLTAKKKRKIAILNTIYPSSVNAVMAKAVKQVVEDEATLVQEAKVLLLLVATTMSTPAQVPSMKIKKEFDYSYQSETLQKILATLNLSNSDPSLFMDSGATSHMTNNVGILSDLKPYKDSNDIYLGNGNKLAITHTGDTCVGKINLQDVHVVPKLKKNLVSSTADNTKLSSLTKIDTKVEPAISANFTVDDITPSVNSNIPVVNYAPAGTDDDGNTVAIDNDSTVDIGTLSTDVLDTVNNDELIVDRLNTASPTIDWDKNTLSIAPRHHYQALKDIGWVEVMKEELETPHSNKTWSLVPRPPSTNVGSKWCSK